MKKIHDMLEAARKGSGRYTNEIKDYIKGFKKIILRGAGKFGTAFGAFLIAEGIPETQLCYWDIRAKELGEVNGIEVMEPFSCEFDREQTLIVNCIPNGSLSGSTGQEAFSEKGYQNYLLGMALFEALMCRMKPGTGFDSAVCIDTTFCNWCACKRLPSILQSHCRQLHLNNFKDELVLPVATFVINQKCSLNCKHCGQYLNCYSLEDRINFPLERIKMDIDRIFDAVDAIGYVSIIGGEPFLHPALNDVIELVLAKPNFGVIGITTNGICNINDNHLKELKNRHIRLIFSDYTISLSEKQRSLFARNIKLASDAGISITVGQPIWAIPASLAKLNFPETTKVVMKTGCNSRYSCKTIQNGVYYPCSITAGIGSHHLADYHPHDWVIIDETRSAGELRERIMHVDEQPYYESCDYCGDGGQLLSCPGEQGFDERYGHINPLIGVLNNNAR